MGLSLEQLRAAFKKSENNGGNRQNNYYPFWDIKEGQTVTVRFIPDKNTQNPMGFLVEKKTHPLTINGEKKTVPCLTMYGEQCPICKVSSAYFKDEGKQSVNGKKFWRKAQQIAQAIIVDDPLPADETTGEKHTGKVRFLALGKQLADVIKEGLGDPDLEENPTDFEGGYDFVIKKTMKDEYASYQVGSKFKGKQRKLTAEELEAVKEQAIDLSTLLPGEPEVEELETMLESAITGQGYTESQKQAKKPASKPVAVETSDDSDDESEESTDETPAKATKVAPKEEPKEFDEEADAILASIRNRKKAQAE